MKTTVDGVLQLFTESSRQYAVKAQEEAERAKTLCDAGDRNEAFKALGRCEAYTSVAQELLGLIRAAGGL